MRARRVTFLLAAGLLAGLFQEVGGVTAAFACGGPTDPCPPAGGGVVVLPGGGGSGVTIGVGTGVGGGVAAGSGYGGSGSGGSGGVVIQPVNGGASTNPYLPGVDWHDLLGAMQASCQSGPVVNPVVPCSQLIPTPPAGGAVAGPPPPPPAIVLALSAWGQLKMPTPVPSRYPSGTLPQDGHPYTVVKANTWFWTDAATWQPVSKTVTAGAVWGRATATTVTLSFTPGDGSAPVSCPGPGSEWKPTEQTWLAPVNAQGCSYKYDRSSRGVGGDDQVTAVYTITWNVTWAGSDGTSGVFNGMQTSMTSRFAVAEVQTVVTR